MINLKEKIAEVLQKEVNFTEEFNISINEMQSMIEIPKDPKMGDYAFPCFGLSKQMKKAPQIIAQELKDRILEKQSNDIIENIDVVGGYLNFVINKNIIIKEVINEYEKNKEMFGSSNEGSGQNIIIDYSSPNIAKEFHIGHLRSTVIGGALYNIYKYLGYNCIGINHLGDWGTQFGKLIEGYKRWGTEYNIEKSPVEELTKIYVRISNACKEDEKILEQCRNNFKKLEDGDSYCLELWEKFRGLSIQEFEEIYKMLGIKFDSYNGEAFYINKMDEIVNMLENSGKLIQSEGAKIIDLEDKGMAPFMAIKSNGSTTYGTRDLAAILFRAKNYDYDKLLYVVSYEQILHFKQVFEVAKLLDMNEKYKNNLLHIPFGMVLLKTGKMSTREGNVIKLKDILDESIKRAYKVIEEKNSELENKEEIAKKIGIGAIIFNDLYNNRIKDEIFDWDIMLNFTGETGPYVQYTYVRTKAILEKAGYIPTAKNVNYEKICDELSIEIIKFLYSFNETVRNAAEKNEPSIISRYLINLAQAFSSFYNENRIIGEDKETQNSRLYITEMVGSVLKNGLKLLGIEVPEKM
ncbi:MAG TPA: arginine--tRNA ligase [Clostridia bacterium]|nr:arginine--tRNA ligase [Clostridia bacterium]